MLRIYAGASDMELKQYCTDLYAKGYFPKAIAEQATQKFHVRIRSYQVCRWAKKGGLPMIHHPRRFAVKLDRQCPICQHFGKVNLAGQTKNEQQRYQCPQCGTNFTERGVCGQGKYSNEIRDLAVNLYLSDSHSTFKSVATTINRTYPFGLTANSVKTWITSKGLQYSVEQKMKNRVYWRRKRYPKYFAIA